MATAVFRFYEELNDFLPGRQRQRDSAVEFSVPCPVRHLIETFGVPHTEVELILINSRSVDLEEPVQDGDRVSVYPIFEALNVAPLLRIRKTPLRTPRFIADAHLGRLARYLRLLGFDTLFDNDPGDQALAATARREGRILLTRDRMLLMHREVTHGCYIRKQRPLDQLAQVIDRCDLCKLIRPFSRCMKCNGLLRRVPKADIADQLPEGTREAHQEFWRCDVCGQLYWRGSHYARLRRLVVACETLGQQG